MNPLGVSPDRVLQDRLAGDIIGWRRDPHALLEQAKWELRVSHQSGRWTYPPRPHDPEPEMPLLPADVLALRSLTALNDLDFEDPQQSRIGALAGLMLDSTPLWLSGQVAEQVANTPTPDELGAELRLPFPAVSVWFAAPAKLPVTDPDLVLPLREPDGDRWLWYGNRQTAPWTLLIGDNERPEPDVWLDGVVLIATDEGEILDTVGWIVSDRNTSEIRSRPTRGVILGSLELAELRDVAYAMAAIAAWGDWLTIQAEPISSGADRKFLRRWVRKNDPAALGPVRVLDVKRSQPERGKPGRGTHASPVTHLRRGHYRRVVVGPRREGREWRWIPPVVVNPDGQSRDQVQIWRLPDIGKNIRDNPKI